MTIDPFRAEENITVPDDLLGRSAGSRIPCLTSNFPLRIHILPIDCNRFAYGHPGGGGLGFAITSESTLETELADRREYLGVASYGPILDRVCAIAGAITGTSVHLRARLALDRMCVSHGGLGSHAVLFTVAMTHVGYHLGLDLSSADIRRLVASNFVEVMGDSCVLGLDTGLASACVLFGGFNLVSDRIHHVWNCFPEQFPSVYLCRLDVPRPSFEGAEDDEMLRRSLAEDRDHRGFRAYEVLMNLIPAIIEGNLNELGRAVWTVQFSGTHLSMIQRYGAFGAEIYGFMGKARHAGIEVVGLSSVGPTCFLVGSDTSRVEAFLDGTGFAFSRRNIAPAAGVAKK